LSPSTEGSIEQNGKVNDAVHYLGQAGGKWHGVPACVGSQIQAPCTRIDLMKKYANIDVQEMYPAGSPPRADNWTMDTFLKAAQACRKGGFPFGIGLGQTTDSVVAAGTIFHSFGAQLVDAKGGLTVKTDEVRRALEYYKKLIAFLPPDVAAWDDASNNKWLIAGKGRADHEPAQRLGSCQARCTANCRTMLDPRLPGGTKRPLRFLPAFFLDHLGILEAQGSRQEPARASLAAIIDREAGGRERL
jgi:Bacterial extracellular solute-binding protein